MPKLRTIHDWTRQLALLPDTEVGEGYKHPNHPDRGYAELYQRHLERYPFLASHPDFLDFLATYSGALVHGIETAEITDCYTTIFGLGPWEMVEECENAVDSNGFYQFAVTDARWKPTNEDVVAIYGLDATGQRGNEVYAALRATTGSDDVPLLPYCANFTEWLRRFVESQGRLLPVELCSLTSEK